MAKAERIWFALLTEKRLVDPIRHDTARPPQPLFDSSVVSRPFNLIKQHVALHLTTQLFRQVIRLKIVKSND